MATGWTDTAIWKLLSAREGSEARSVKATLENPRVMREIETVLGKGGSDGTTDFTLHDEEHSFRVAERMVEIISPDVAGELSVYELALLLLSAYLHDIGMTPGRGKVTGLLRFLLWEQRDPSDPNLSERELSELQTFLDEQGRGEMPGMMKRAASPEVQARGEELITNYCRRRHNEWSKDWIDANLGNHVLGEYRDWVPDLTDLCQSHHWGKAELLQERFDPKRVSNGEAVVHLRFLACILRVADILENDPKRTPEIIFRMRNIRSSSRIYWHKDHAMSARFNELGVLTFAARPRSAAIERACRDTLSWIVAELRLCRTLDAEKPFAFWKFSKNSLPHIWRLQDTYLEEIRSSGDYVYIDGAFRPDTSRLLQILSGVELYGDPLTAVRELLQNAFDAVREQTAYERLSFLERTGAKNTHWEAHKDDFHEVRLELVNRGSEQSPEWWLVCRDDGVGMTREILEKHLLISGSAPRAEITALERRCENAGFGLGRTGQFGIGVLSYFMLSDRVEIETRRSQDAGGDPSNTGWSFWTEGVGMFGELRRINRTKRGSEVALRISQSVLEMGDWKEHFSSISEALKHTLREELVRVPCGFRFAGHPSGEHDLQFQSGWCSTAADWSERSVPVDPPWDHYLRHGDEILNFTDEATRAKHAQDRAHWDSIRQTVVSAMKWQFQEGKIPGSLGWYRFGVPYFHVAGSSSMAYFATSEVEAGLRVELIGGSFAIFPEASTKDAWKGMKIDVDRTNWRQAQHVEFDWTGASAGTIAVHRGELALTSTAEASEQEVLRRLFDERSQFVADSHPSRFDAVNFAAASMHSVPDPNNEMTRLQSTEIGAFEWLVPDRGERSSNGTWRTMAQLGLITDDLWSLPKTGLLSAHLGRTRLEIVHRLGESHVPVYRPDRGPVPARQLLRPWRAARVYGTSETIVVYAPAKEAGLHRNVVDYCLFPPEWRHLLAIRGADEAVMNIEHPLIQMMGAEHWKRFSSISYPEFLMIPKSDVFANDHAAAAWVCEFVRRDFQQAPSVWMGLVERCGRRLVELWRKVFANEEHSFQWRGQFSDKECTATRCWDSPILRGLSLPDPGPEWTVYFESDESKKEGDEQRGAVGDKRRRKRKR